MDWKSIWTRASVEKHEWLRDPLFDPPFDLNQLSELSPDYLDPTDPSRGLPLPNLGPGDKQLEFQIFEIVLSNRSHPTLDCRRKDLPSVGRLLPENLDCYEKPEYVPANRQELQLYIFGRTLLGTSLTVKVSGFMPSFLLRWKHDHYQEERAYHLLVDKINSYLSANVRDLSREAASSHYLIKKVTKFPMWYVRLRKRGVSPGKEQEDHEGKEPKGDLLEFEKHDLLEIFVSTPFMLGQLAKELRQTRYRDLFQGLPLSSKRKRDQCELEVGKIFDSETLEVYHQDISPINQFLMKARVRAMGWVSLPWKYLRLPEGCETTQNLELQLELRGYDRIDPSRYFRALTKEEQVDPLILSFDTEFLGNHGFPEEGNLEDECFMINVTVARKGVLQRACFTHGPIDTRPEVVQSKLARLNQFYGIKEDDPYPILPFDRLYIGKDPQAFLNYFRNYVTLTVNPDIVTGYNVNLFDFPFLHSYAEAVRQQSPAPKEFLFFHMTRFWGKPIRCNKELRYDKTAARNNARREWYMDGRVTFDPYPWFKSNRPLPKYTLDQVALRFLKVKKIDQSIEEMNRGRIDRCPEIMLDAALYCQRDADLPIHLIEHQQCIVQEIKLGYVTNTLLSEVVGKGQQNKVTNQINTHILDPSINMYNNNPSDIGRKLDIFPFDGAYVFNPLAGFYNKKKFVIVLDFTSLYPNIMYDNNLDYSTQIKDPEVLKLLPPEAYNTFHCRDGRVHHFLRPDYQPLPREGVIDSLLVKLLEQRALVKKEMKKVTDSNLKKVLDGTQLALKVSANSIYGYTGVEEGKNPNNCIAEVVTTFGQKLLRFTEFIINHLRDGHSRKVIYGDTDSVFYEFQLSEQERARITRQIEEAKERGETIEGDLFLKFAIEQGGRDATLVTDELRKRGFRRSTLLFEKVFQNLFIAKKKTYFGAYYTNHVKMDKIERKGDKSVKRDTPPLISRLLSGVQKMLVEHGDGELAVQYLREFLLLIMVDQFPFEDYIYSKSLQKDYKINPEQKIVNDKMERRNPGSQFFPGDRVPMVILQKGGDQVRDRADDPEYAREHLNENPIDRAHYVRALMKKSVCEIMVVAGFNVEALFEGAITYLEGRALGHSSPRSRLGFVSLKNSSSSSQAFPTIAQFAFRFLSEIFPGEKKNLTAKILEDVYHLNKRLPQAKIQPYHPPVVEDESSITQITRSSKLTLDDLPCVPFSLQLPPLSLLSSSGSGSASNPSSSPRSFGSLRPTIMETLLKAKARASKGTQETKPEGGVSRTPPSSPCSTPAKVEGCLEQPSLNPQPPPGPSPSGVPSWLQKSCVASTPTSISSPSSLPPKVRESGRGLKAKEMSGKPPKNMEGPLKRLFKSSSPENIQGKQESGSPPNLDPVSRSNA